MRRRRLETRIEREMSRRDVYIAAPLCVLMVLLCVSAFTGFWPWSFNPYPSYALQAEAWLNGHLDLGQDYAWLELAIVNGKYYVSFPPFPSYVLLPFVILFGGAENCPDSLIAWCVTAVGVITAVRLCFELGLSPMRTLFWTLYLYLGSGYLFIAQTAWVWFFAQTMAFTLTLLSLEQALEGRGGFSLAFWAMAVGCRPMQVLYLPLLFLLLREQERTPSVPRWILSHLSWAIAPCLIAASYMLLNTLRFSDPLEFGHNYLPEFVRAPEGQFSLSYVPTHLWMLIRLPTVNPATDALIFEHLETTAFFIICPLSVTYIFALIRGMVRRRFSLLTALIPFLLVLHVFLICMHRTLGGFQFGNRYFVDLMPVLLLGLLRLDSLGTHMEVLQTPLLLFGCAVNLLGSVMVYQLWSA